MEKVCSACAFCGNRSILCVLVGDRAFEENKNVTIKRD
jgi:hypothetical protein